MEDSEFSGAMLQAIMVFYGLAVALIAVSVWQTYADVSKIISEEASSIAGLYRDVSCYPEPQRTTLQGDLKDYVEYILDKAWPLQQKGKVPSGGVQLMDKLQTDLVAFEPTTDGQKILHGETLRAYNHMIQARRLRLDSVTTALPGVLWMVIALGAMISLSASFMFKVEDARLHGLLVVLLAAFIGLVIFIILALDHPYRGDLGLRPDAYRLIYEHLMQR